MEQREVIEVVRVKMICPSCFKGEMKPAYYEQRELSCPHQCNKCGYKESYATVYPFIEYDVDLKY